MKVMVMLMTFATAAGQEKEFLELVISGRCLFECWHRVEVHYDRGQARRQSGCVQYEGIGNM